MIDLIVPLLFGFLILVSFVGYIALWRLFGQLRDGHPETFEALGSPHMFLNNTPINNFRVLRFLITAEWRQLADPAVAARCRFIRGLLVVSVPTWILFATLVLVIIFRADAPGP